LIEMEYVYLIREREFRRLGETVLKIGKSRQLNCQRKNQYPKFSELYGIVSVSSGNDVETKLKREFKKKFRQREYGHEYFEGDLKGMVKLFLEIAHGDYVASEVKRVLGEGKDVIDPVSDVGDLSSVPSLSKFLEDPDCIYELNVKKAVLFSEFALSFEESVREKVKLFANDPSLVTQGLQTKRINCCKTCNGSRDKKYLNQCSCAVKSEKTRNKQTILIGVSKKLENSGKSV